MRNLFLLLVLSTFGAIFSVSGSFSQQSHSLDPRTFNSKTGNSIFQPESLMRIKTLTDSTRKDTVKTEKPKAWWETLLDFSFWNKLSGPGPFLGAGIEYPVFKYKNTFAVFIGASVSHSLDNTLQYYKTVPRTIIEYDTSGFPIDTSIISVDSCFLCGESKAVQMVSLKVDVQYRIQKSQFDLFLGLGLHTFFGEAFPTFSRISGTFGAGWRVLKYIRVGLMANVFEHFRPSKFGAVDGQDSTGSVEFVPGAFISVSLH